jgi:hypothetical protein
MNWKIIGALFVVVLGLGAFLLIEIKQEKKAEPKRKEQERLLAFDKDRVSEFKIQIFDTTYVVSRRNSEWVMQEPLKGSLADSLLVNHLLRIVQRIGIGQKIPADSIDLSQVYLDPPVLSFKVFFDYGDSAWVDFGMLNNTTSNIYCRRNAEDKVLLIPGFIGPMLSVNSMMIRTKQLMAVHPMRARSVRYAFAPGQEVVAVHDTSTGQWWIETGKGRRLADKLQIMNVLSRLYENQVREFQPSDAVELSRAGLKQPLRTLTVEELDGSRNTVSFGRPQENRQYLLWASSSLYPDNLVLVDSFLVSYLDRLNPGNLVNKRMTFLDIYQVNRIQLLYPTGPVELVEQNDTTWKIVQPKESPCRLTQVDRILTQVDTMSAVEVLGPGGNRGFDRPQLTLVLSSGDKVLGRFIVGDYVGSNLYLRDDIRGLDFIAPVRDLERLSYSFKDLADIPVQHVVQ